MKKDMIMNEMMAVIGNNHYIIITLQYARISSIDLLFGVIPYMMTMKEISQLGRCFLKTCLTNPPTPDFRKSE